MKQDKNNNDIMNKVNQAKELVNDLKTRRESLVSELTAVDEALTQLGHGAQKKRGRPPGSKNQKKTEAAPVQQTQG